MDEFDEAVKSRIHLALQFQQPPETLRQRIWKEHLLSIPLEECDANLQGDGTAVSLIVRDDMNGREISNSINTARTLARHQGQKLGIGHLETVMKVWRDFNKSVSQSIGA